MKNQNHFIVIILGVLFTSMIFTITVFAENKDIGYRKLNLGNTREQVRQTIKNNFSDEYTASEDAGNTVVLTKKDVNRPAIIITLVFDQNNILYKINVRIQKIASTPKPDDVIKSIEEKYGKPAKKSITSSLDDLIYWNMDENRYEIFLQNISSWLYYEILYMDTVVQKQKEKYDAEKSKKPRDKALDF